MTNNVLVVGQDVVESMERVAAAVNQMNEWREEERLVVSGLIDALNRNPDLAVKLAVLLKIAGEGRLTAPTDK
jgi:hypothetical protein